MTPTWHSDTPPPKPPALTVGGSLRIVVAGGLLGATVFGGLLLLLAMRLIERPLFGARRPLTPWIKQGVCRLALKLLRIDLQVTGAPDPGAQAWVANHASWLDIFVLNACGRVYFVSKAEVAGWPGIGWLARATGTIFITRDRGSARRHRDLIADRLERGHLLVLFPEGTSTDGRQVIPFKSTLLEPFLNGASAPVQPVALRYAAPKGRDARHYGWWGDMDFGPHLRTVLTGGRGAVRVRFLPVQQGAEATDRKALAGRLTQTVAAAHGDLA